MLDRRFIEQHLPVLTAGMPLKEALSLLASSGVDRLAVIEAGTQRFLGMADILLLDAFRASGLKMLPKEWQLPVALHTGMHLQDVLRIFRKTAASFLPVVSAEQYYIGVVKRTNIENALFEQLSIDREGALLSIELPQRDFTLSNIVRLIESEQGKILGLTVQQPEVEEGTYLIHIKLMALELARITAALRRHGYEIIFASGDELLELEMNARADEFLHYLNI